MHSTSSALPFFFRTIPRTPTSPLFPYTTLFRSYLDLHLGQEIDHIFGAAVKLGVALLAAEALHFGQDRKSTRLNSSHPSISYAVFCLKKKNNHNVPCTPRRDKTEHPAMHTQLYT